ncbi:DUF3157 domain-containing protein [Photobacterium sanctipauli]|uniref:DUF3157 domain-containing protein n=1 Tax=Photobacterium sanctipauli TaxID=1342794 RepID=A0A2T3NNB8_9GAMM|nr:DUF3157 family protein [Photobacterium sanctipauli]PSW17180.1 DUF3157 domain-containing protein [Photobacterium sanctipauli]
MKPLKLIQIPKLAFSFGLVFGTAILAADVSAEPMKATLQDGREVMLYPDNTWRFIPETLSVPESSSVSKKTSASSAAALSTSTPTSTSISTTEVKPQANPKPVSNTAPITAPAASATVATASAPVQAPDKVQSSSVTQPGIATPDGILIEPGTGKQVEAAQRSGVTLTLEPASYQNGELLIPTSLKNDSTGSIVLVELALKLHSAKGELIAREDQKVWTSIKRMPETYFRPDTEREGRTLRFKVLSAKQYYLEAEITEVDHW